MVPLGKIVQLFRFLSTLEPLIQSTFHYLDYFVISVGDLLDLNHENNDMELQSKPS